MGSCDWPRLGPLWPGQKEDRIYGCSIRTRRRKAAPAPAAAAAATGARGGEGGARCYAERYRPPRRLLRRRRLRLASAARPLEARGEAEGRTFGCEAKKQKSNRRTRAESRPRASPPPPPVPVVATTTTFVEQTRVRAVAAAAHGAFGGGGGGASCRSAPGGGDRASVVAQPVRHRWRPLHRLLRVLVPSAATSGCGRQGDARRRRDRRGGADNRKRFGGFAAAAVWNSVRAYRSGRRRLGRPRGQARSSRSGTAASRRRQWRIWSDL